MSAAAAAELAARQSYGRLVAFLARRSRDIAAVEDALADAFAKALEAWPRDGVPARPEAWLLTVARRRLADGARRRRVREEALPALTLAAEEADSAMRETVFPDDRLRLLFICAHPAIDPAARAALMLQTVLGLDAATIASAFLVRPSAMSQRLLRAKTKIRDAGIAFAEPDRDAWAPRIAAVLDAVYAAYGAGWADPGGADPARSGLAAEALHLARMTAGLMPAEPEPKGLLALMLFCEARRGARRDGAGRFVPLSEQDVSLWSTKLLAEAEGALAAAAALRRLGPFQLEAAIQSAHAERARGRPVDWAVVVQLYDGLLRHGRTLGAEIGRAAALAEAGEPQAGLAALFRLDEERLRDHQPFWAVRADLLRRLGRAEAAAAYRRAIGLTEDPAVRAFLVERAASASPI